MKVDEIAKPQGLVLQITTKDYPPHSPSKTFYGLVAEKHFVVLDKSGITGEVLPVSCALVGLAEVVNVWPTLKAFYSN